MKEIENNNEIFFNEDNKKEKEVDVQIKKNKITVLRCTINEDFIREYANKNIELCPLLSEGQIFISIDGAKPEGFCDFAWININKYIYVLLLDGNYDLWMKDSSTQCIKFDKLGHLSILRQPDSCVLGDQ